MDTERCLALLQIGVGNFPLFLKKNAKDRRNVLRMATKVFLEQQMAAPAMMNNNAFVDGLAIWVGRA